MPIYGSKPQETKKSRNITFRLTNEQYEQVENAALAAGEDPNSWCRKVALIQLTEGFSLTKNDRLLYERFMQIAYQSTTVRSNNSQLARVYFPLEL